VLKTGILDLGSRKPESKIVNDRQLVLIRSARCPNETKQAISPLVNGHGETDAECGPIRSGTARRLWMRKTIFVQATTEKK